MGFFSKTDALDEQLSFKSAAPIEELLDIPVDEIIEDEVVEQEPEGTKFDIESYWNDQWIVKVSWENPANGKQEPFGLPSYIMADGDRASNSNNGYSRIYVKDRETAIKLVKDYLTEKLEAVRTKEKAILAGPRETTTVYL